MKIPKILKILIILQILVQTIFAQEQYFSFTLKTANTDSVFQKIITAAESKGGYFTNHSDYYLSIRLPVSNLQEFQKTIESLAKIESKNFSSTDRTADLERLSLQIQSRKKLLENYMDMVKNAPFSELQSVEREMVNLNAQIENLQGQYQAMQKRTALAQISIHATSITPPYRPTKQTKSPFTWINSTNLNSLREDF